MNEQQSEVIITSTQPQSQQQSQQLMQQQVDAIIDKLQPQLQSLILISSVIMVVFVIITLINSVYKWRVERAILRMDRNLKKLVDGNPAALATEQVSGVNGDENQQEQK